MRDTNKKIEKINDNIFKGKSGEEIAARYIKSRGLRILERNFKTNIGELDIIATDDEILIFIEVKARTSDNYGFPSEAVTYHKQRKISMVASQYIKLRMLSGVDVRFDIIEVYLNEKRVNHIESAFDSFLRY